MLCSHAYRIANSKYIYCNLEGTPIGTSLNDLSPYMCIYQKFPPNSGGNTDVTNDWVNCPKLAEYVNPRKIVLVADWQADGTYTDYPYRAAIPMAGATTDVFPYVEFETNEAESGNYADVSISYDGGVYIYCKEIPQTDIYVNVYIFVEEGA